MDKSTSSTARPPRSKLEWMKKLRRADLTHAQFRVLTMVSTYTDKRGQCAFPGAKRLADDCGMTRSNVHRILKQLRQLGWLIVEAEGGNHVKKGYATVYALGSPKGVTTTPKGVMSTPEGSHGDTPSGHTPDHNYHSESEHSASFAHAPDDAQEIQPKTRNWDSFNDLDELENWLDWNVRGWRFEYDLENAVWMMWENDRHPRYILEYVCSRFGMRLAA